MTAAQTDPGHHPEPTLVFQVLSDPIVHEMFSVGRPLQLEGDAKGIIVDKYDDGQTVIVVVGAKDAAHAMEAYALHRASQRRQRRDLVGRLLLALRLNDSPGALVPALERFLTEYNELGRGLNYAELILVLDLLGWEEHHLLTLLRPYTDEQFAPFPRVARFRQDLLAVSTEREAERQRTEFVPEIPGDDEGNRSRAAAPVGRPRRRTIGSTR
ncbi:hypothetical protein HGA91_06695 [candidate division WWE3 bacterium]|nr:hypothetical protein [candidate division WWE3 bacterium]